MECFLNCCDRTHDPVPLPDGKPVVVGRSRETKIADKKCSKNQVKLTANYKTREVHVEQLGNNPCSVGSKELSCGESSVLGPGGKICLLHDKYPHFVYFKTPSLSTSPAKGETKYTDQCGEAVSASLDSQISSKSKVLGKRKMNKTRNCDSQPAKKHKTSSVKYSEEEIKENAKIAADLAEDIDLEEVKEEFGEEMVKEIKKMKGDSNIHLDVKSSKNKSESDALKSGAPCVASKWEEIPDELLIYTRKGVEGREKVAGFDMDGTIITTKSGRVFPTNTADWKILMPQIPGKLKSLWNEGYKIVIFTNQNGIGKKKVNVPDFKKKIENIIALINIPIQVFISPGIGHYRKPSTGMWKYLNDKENQGVKIDSETSMYIGDAAGRPANWQPKRKKDFSCSDRAFASNIGVKFYTPEEFFLKKKPAPFNWPAFDPKKLSSDGPLFSPSTADLTSKQPELIVMVGFPASGKTTFAKQYLVPQGYARINRDTLGTWQKCVSTCRTALSQGKHVVVDNTSPDKETRKRYIECAEQTKVPARCFLMDVSIEHAKHNNTVRETTNADNNYKRVGHMAFVNYKSSYQEPNCSEGFTEVLKIHFKPKFDDTATKELYCQYLHA